MSKTLLTPAILAGYNPHPDNTMTFRFRTQELSEEQKLDAITHYQKFGWLGFVDSEDATDLEIPTTSPVKEGKTPQQRLRAILYVYWKEKGKGETFEQWYEQAIEKYIESIKTKLDEL